MKIVDAIWEKRNLGVSTQEVTVDKEDSIDEIKGVISSLTGEYQVVKIPTGSIGASWILEDAGFRYIETTIHVTRDLKDISLDSIKKRIDSGVSYEEMSDIEIDDMETHIREGMFDTDRVSMDPFFSKEQSANRYIGWIRDEIERGADVYKYVYKGENVGFFTLKEIDTGVYYPFLAGIYKEYSRNPFGMVYLYKPMVEAKKRGGNQISTYISTNNHSAMRMHVSFGFDFKNTMNVFIKHG